MMRLATMAALSSLITVISCKPSEAPHDHSAAHPDGHDHHQAGHGHGDAAFVSMTLWSEKFELFVEHPPAFVGQPVSVLAHLTSLDGFRALERATLTMELDGPAHLKGETFASLRPGIFQISMTPTEPGTYRGRLQISGAAQGSVEGVELEVFADEHASAHAAARDDDDGRIEFLKEQQWGVPFATAFAASGSVVASVEVAGRIDTPPGGSAEVGAPLPGRLVAPKSGLLWPGAKVHKGQVLASLLPSPSSPEAAARASLAVAEAHARASRAKLALERAERLIRDEAIPERELEDAQREIRVAQESVRAAKQAAALYSGARGKSAGRGTWHLTAPIDGTLVSVSATPGANVSPGQPLFRIVDTTQLWVIAQVPEQDAARLRTDRNPSFQLAGLDDWHAIRIAGTHTNASIISVGQTVDRASRTVEVIYALREPVASMRVGGLLRVSLPAGNEHTGVVIPRSALIDQEGRDIVYVQVDGEHFQERLVRLGPLAGTDVGIRSGLRTGERIVTRGAHLVRLADRASTTQAHGHIH
ncbi:MAG: efflux RND transporter periplasmic adaptor subunit [Nannocystaceae bacterium]